MTELAAYLEKIKHLIPSAADLQLERLTEGYTNHTFLLSWDDSPKAIMRVPDVDATLFQISRIAEKQAVRVASANLLSPSCFYFDSITGLMVSQYVPQKTYDWSVQHIDADIIRLAQALRSIHALPTNGAEFHVGHTIEHYLREAANRLSIGEVGHEEIDWLAQVANPYLQQIAPYEGVMCHNDLNPKNCLADPMHFWVIDWEYAAEGDPLFDIALVFQSHNFTPAQQALFFEHYSADAPTADWQATIANYQKLYQIRELAWMLLKTATSKDENDWQNYSLYKEMVTFT